MKYALATLVYICISTIPIAGQDTTEIIAPAFSKEAGSTWITARLGNPKLYGDIGRANPQFFGKKISGGIGIYRMMLKRLNSGILMQYSYISNQDASSESYSRSYGSISNLFEFGIHAEYKLFEFFKEEKVSFDVCLGGIANYMLASSIIIDYNSGEVFDQSGHEGIVHCTIFYPNLSVYLTADKFRFGLGFEQGFSSNDYLDGYSPPYTSYNDRLGRILVSFGYKIDHR